MVVRSAIPIRPDRTRVLWNRATLQQLLQISFQGVPFIAVSNREPYIHRFNNGSVECIQPASGLTVALDPIMQATGGTWVAHGSGSADRLTVDAQDHVRVPPEAPRYTVRRVWLDKETEERYYYGLANEGLWPLCHIAFHRPIFRRRDWESYRLANQAFAEAVLEEAAGGPAVVFIQDYHFALLPRILKDRNPKLTIAQFWHIPWPNREVFRAFPWTEELLDGLLGNDLLGFHLRYHCANFLETIERGLEAMVDTERSTVARFGARTRVRAFPISIDFDEHNAVAESAPVRCYEKAWRAQFRDDVLLGLGIDRADYTKGIPDRLIAIDRLLETHPEYRGRLMFLQIAVPSRTRIAAYERLNREIAELAATINARWESNGWRPIDVRSLHLPKAELIALHRIADFCVVSSLNDGMNLVAKEFVASRTDTDGVLILSSFTGAARELTSALPINPFSADQIADAMHSALTMAPSERRRRMYALREAVRENNIYRWAADIVLGLEEASGVEQPWLGRDARAGASVL
jgi:trehalose-6-phosphate synthase